MSRIGARQAGFTLVELMVGLVLGLIVAGAASAVYLSSKSAYNATESVGRLQESTRTAFELMARELREAGGTACGAGLPTINALNGGTTNWWSDFGSGVTGYNDTVISAGTPFGTAKGNRVSGTDAIDLKSSSAGAVRVDDHQPTSAQFKVNTKDHGLNDGDIVMVCDFDHASIFQITNASPGTNVTIVHNTGTGTPGNATKCLAWGQGQTASTDALCNKCQTPTGKYVDCGGSEKSYAFGCNYGVASGSSCKYGSNKASTIARLRSTRWFIGCNGRDDCSKARGRSLYQTVLTNNSGTLSQVANEVTPYVMDMQLTYLLPSATSYVDSSSVAAADWAKVKAVRVTLTMESEDRTGVDSAKASKSLERTLQHTVLLRNRAP